MFFKRSRPLYLHERVLFDAKSVFGKALITQVKVQDKNYVTRFVCGNRKEAHRAATLWLKEPGTMSWLDENLRGGDVFLDIGANIGIYTLAAAHRVGATGTVYACEPHKPNCVALMKNVLANGFGATVKVFSSPLGSVSKVAPFNYRSFEVASTGSQLGTSVLNNKEFRPAVSELCLQVSVDDLVEKSAMLSPSLVKIDVDGLELDILKGMEGVLRSTGKPRSVQVELNMGEQDAVVGFMIGCGYELALRHFTMIGQRQLESGKPVELIPHNAIFLPKG